MVVSLSFQKMSFVKNYLQHLNVFPPSDDRIDQEDENQRRSSILATRLYFFALALGLVIIAVFVWLNRQTTIVTVEYPSIGQFEALPFDAHCPCSRASVSYGEFTSVQATFHQVCSSDFVSDQWIEAIFSGSNATYFYLRDFRVSGSAQFQALASFCRLAAASVAESTSLFYRTVMVSAQVQSAIVVQSQAQAVMDQFILTAPDQFKAQLQLVREMTVGNTLLSELQTNAMLTYTINDNHQTKIQRTEVVYLVDEEKECSCVADLGCGTGSIITNIFGEPTPFDVSDDSELLMEISGLVTGCLPVDSILVSTLECFYSEICLDQLLSYFPTTVNFAAMAESNTSRFKSNSKVQTVVDALMVETWITNISYARYYAQCAPILCTYSINERHDFVFVVIKLIRSLGGLTVIFGLIIPMIIRFIRRPRHAGSTPCKFEIMTGTRVLSIERQIAVRKVMLRYSHSVNSGSEQYLSC